MHSIDLSVSYGLREYISFVRDFGVWHQATEGGKTDFVPSKRGVYARFVHTATVYLLAPPIFIMKKRAVGNCKFNINESRVLRQSRNGDIELHWTQVRRVHRLSQAYLIQEEQGAMPLPYRAFTPQQLQQFEGILKSNSITTLGTR
ncbi:MAG: YcxB family protein [Candidatus Competibacter sp.]|nr:YcxB family protein [Candidatus Competibacter sp.]MDG4582940.1 YcxB family protein [Candidatus Competibacter sp.]